MSWCMESHFGLNSNLKTAIHGCFTFWYLLLPWKSSPGNQMGKFRKCSQGPFNKPNMKALSPLQAKTGHFCLDGDHDTWDGTGAILLEMPYVDLGILELR